MKKVYALLLIVILACAFNLWYNKDTKGKRKEVKKCTNGKKCMISCAMWLV